MEVLSFLKSRTAFIERYYAITSTPIVEMIEKIENGVFPYEQDTHSEDGEPAFLEEWEEAQTYLEVLGASCVSMLAESLKLYFATWEAELNWRCSDKFKNEFKAEAGSWVNGYVSCFSRNLSLDLKECSVDFSVLEQVVLFRNDTQHPKSISMIQGTHQDHVTFKYPIPYFISDLERRMIGQHDQAEDYWLPIRMSVTKNLLVSAIQQVNALGEYFEERLFLYKYRHFHS